jgi:hypothetical protein
VPAGYEPPRAGGSALLAASSIDENPGRVDDLDVIALIVSGIAILISLGSLIFTWRNDRRAGRAERRGRRADLFVVHDAGSYTPGQLPRTFNLLLRNRGRATARDVRLWLNDKIGWPVSTVVEFGQFLHPDNQPHAGSVDLLQVDVDPAELQVWVSYEDDDGPQRERLDVQLS